MSSWSSTKTYCHNIGLSCCFRQWRAESHCRFLHGYALQVKLEFRTSRLDKNNWCVDFGSLKPIKAWLEETFDHKLLVAKDDPFMDNLKDLGRMGLAQIVLVDHIGCEGFAEMIYNHVYSWLQKIPDWKRVELHSVEVREHEGNSAIYRGRD